MATTEPSITRQSYHMSGSNGRVDVFVAHDEEYQLSDSSAENIAGYFTQSGAGGSCTYVVDRDSHQHCVPESRQAWHAPPNAHTLGWERDGYASWSLRQWMQPAAQWTTCNVAASMAVRALAYNIPIVFINAAQQRAGARGITTHRERSWAFGQSDHNDPGPYFPIATFMGLIARAHGLLAAGIENCQAKIGAKVDGDAGVETIMKLGAYLYKNAATTVPAPAPKPAPQLGALPLVVDGVPGVHTWAAWQRAVGSTPDGIPGPDTWKHIQRRVGVADDGEPGPITWKAVQKRVNVAQDGEPGPITWRAIQTSLNNKKF